MRVTFNLSDEQFAAADRQGLMVGLPLTVQLDAGALAAAQESGVGWFQRTAPGRPLLKPFSLNRSLFHGPIEQIEWWQDDESGDLFGQASVDCGVPLRLDLIVLADASDRSPRDLHRRHWLLGVAALNGLLAFDPGDLLWQPVDGVIVDIQRLSLDPLNPDFGVLRWLQSLPRRSFAPDLVFVTVEV